MNILLVEDDEIKRANVAAFLAESFQSLHLAQASSYNSAIRALDTSVPKFVILDMSLPIFDVNAEEDGYQVDAFGGIEVLGYALRRSLDTKIIVLTQFETLGDGTEMISTQQLGEKLQVEFASLYLGLIYYSPAESSWKDALTNLLKK